MIKDSFINKYNVKSKVFDIEFKDSYKAFNPSIIKMKIIHIQWFLEYLTFLYTMYVID
jgi:hypothetical protein